MLHEDKQTLTVMVWYDKAMEKQHESNGDVNWHSNPWINIEVLVHSALLLLSEKYNLVL